MAASTFEKADFPRVQAGSKMETEPGLPTNVSGDVYLQQKKWRSYLCHKSWDYLSQRYKNWCFAPKTCSCKKQAFMFECFEFSLSFETTK